MIANAASAAAPAARVRKRKKTGCFQLLQERMRAHGVTQTALATRLHISEQSVRRRLNAVTEWTRDEMYRVMDLLDIPETDMYLYWPRDCVSAERSADKSVRDYLVETNQSLVSDSTLDGLIALVEAIEKARVPHGRHPRAV